MDKLSLYIFLSFTESSWEAASPLVFSFYVVSQIVFNVLGTPQLIMASTEGLPKSSPIPTHTAAVVTTPTLWWCTSFQDPCLPLKFLTLYPTEINTAILSLLIPPSHNCLKKLGLPDTKHQESCKLMSLLAWLGGNHSAPRNEQPRGKLLNPAGA